MKIPAAMLDLEEECLDFEAEDYEQGHMFSSTTLNNNRSYRSLSNNRGGGDHNLITQENVHSGKLLSYPPHLNHLKYTRKSVGHNGFQKEFPPFENRPQFLKDIDSGNFSDLSNDAGSESTIVNSRKNINRNNSKDKEREQNCDISSPDDDIDSGSDRPILTDDESHLLEEEEDEYYEEEEEPEIKPSSFFENKKIIFGSSTENDVFSGHQTVPRKDGKRKGSPNELENESSVPRNVVKKWDAVYVANISPDKICLRDLGYIPLETKPTENRTSLGSSVQSQTKSTYDQILPPVKRPPTRVSRFTDGNTNNVSTVTDKKKTFAEKPPAVFESSLFKHGFNPSNNNREDALKKDRSPSPKPTFKLPINRPPTKSGSRTSTMSKEHQNQKKINQPESYFETSFNATSREDDGLSLVAPTLASFRLNWSEEEEPMVTGTMDTTQDIDDEEWESITTVWAKNQESNRVPYSDERIDFSNVPDLFGGLCYHHFFFGSCNNKSKCNMMHFVKPALIQRRCTKSTKDMVLKAYKFSLRMPNLYKETHLCFISAFAYFKMRREIVQCIGDFLKFEKLISIFGAVEEVIKGLEETGMTFLDAIQLLILNYGLMNQPLLVDILLEMLIEQPYLNSEHWHLIRTYCLAKDNISAEIAERIISRCINDQCDPKLYPDIFNVIVESDIVDLSSIDEGLLTKFKMLRNMIPEHDPPASSLVAFRNPPALALPVPNIQQPPPQFLLPPPPPIRQLPPQLPNLSEPPPKIINPPHSKLNFEPPATLRFDTRPASRALPTPAPLALPTPPPPALIPLMELKFSPPSTTLEDASVSRPMEKISIEPNTVQPQETKLLPCGSSEHETYVHHSQSDNQIQNVDLFPPAPIIGKRKNNSNYIRKHFLHHLLPISKQSVDIHESDVKRLDQAVMNGDGRVFFDLMKEYSRPTTVESLTTLVIAQLKGVTNIMKVFNKLINSLSEVKPDYDKIPFVKGILEVLVMNLLFELSRRNMPRLASDLLCNFRDWDSLTTAKIFVKGMMSEMGIYLFFAKMLTIGEKYVYAIDIILCPTLHLLEPRSSWPFLSVERDLVTRDKILDGIVIDSHKQCFKKTMHLFLQTLPTGIFNYDIRKPFNNMMIVLLDKKKLTPLKMILDHIEIFYKYMDENVFRAFYIITYNHITELELKLSIYELCCERGIYTLYKGTERIIALTADMSVVEVEYILCYFFKKLCRLSVAPGNDLTIELRPSKSSLLMSPIILSQNIPRHHGEMCRVVQGLIKDNYHLDMEVDITRTSLHIRRQNLFRWWNQERNNTLF